MGVAGVGAGFVVTGGFLEVGEPEWCGPDGGAGGGVGPGVGEGAAGFAAVVFAAELADVAGRGRSVRIGVAVFVVAVDGVAGAAGVAAGDVAGFGEPGQVRVGPVAGGAVVDEHAGDRVGDQPAQRRARRGEHRSDVGGGDGPVAEQLG